MNGLCLRYFFLFTVSSTPLIPAGPRCLNRVPVSFSFLWVSPNSSFCVSSEEILLHFLSTENGFIFIFVLTSPPVRSVPSAWYQAIIGCPFSLFGDPFWSFFYVPWRLVPFQDRDTPLLPRSRVFSPRVRRTAPYLPQQLSSRLPHFRGIVTSIGLFFLSYVVTNATRNLLVGFLIFSAQP